MKDKPIVRFDGEYDFLSNFFYAPIEIGGYTFTTNEHAFQAAKYIAMPVSRQKQYVLQVASVETPSKSKYLGRSATIDVEKWDSVKVRAMRDIVMVKFLQHEDLRARLVATDAAMLVEGNDWNDTFWGRCEGKGRNVLGSILMEVRGYFLWKEEHDGYCNYYAGGGPLFCRGDW